MNPIAKQCFNYTNCKSVLGWTALLHSLACPHEVLSQYWIHKFCKMRCCLFEVIGEATSCWFWCLVHRRTMWWYYHLRVNAHMVELSFWNIHECFIACLNRVLLWGNSVHMFKFTWVNQTVKFCLQRDFWTWGVAPDLKSNLLRHCAACPL